jgi:hypothetical protein
LPLPSYNQHGAEVIQKTNCIPIGDVFRLIVKAADQSRNPRIREKAGRFEGWIFDEVLPSIQKHGAYITPAKLDEIENDPAVMRELLNALIEERRRHGETLAAYSELTEKYNDLSKTYLELHNEHETVLLNNLELADAVETLQEEKDILTIALNDSLEWWTVAKYNSVHNMGWNLTQTQQIGRRLTAICYANGINPRPVFTNDERFKQVKSYPVNVWEAFIGFLYPWAVF